jgi:drug/metabolite transporter (DMT)-like permease
MSKAHTIFLTCLAMMAFAGNSLHCRLALKHTSVDAASFTTVRLIAGAVVLWMLVRIRGGAPAGKGNWPSVLMLFIYAAGFSFAYVALPTATGALLLFGAVQATILGGIVFLDEAISLRLALACVTILGSIALVILGKKDSGTV